MLFKLFISVLIFEKANVLHGHFLECSTKADCLAKDATCEDFICECPAGQVFSLDYLKCLPIVTRYQADCEDDNQCGWLLGKNGCIDGKCVCNEGWRFYHGKCSRSVGLNETCILDEECYNGYDIRAMVCTNRKCSCNPDGYYLRGNYDCRPQSDKAEYCSLSSDCIGDRICSFSQCIDEPKPESLNLSSALKINSYKNDDTPKITTYFKLLDGPCENDAECEVPNTYCYSATKTCTCKRGYFYKSDEDGCVGELGSTCENDGDCKMDYAACENGKCYCRKSYFTLPSNAACQKPMTHDNFFCNNKERCHVLGANAVCLNNECSCATSYEVDEDFVCRYSQGATCNGCNNDEDCSHTLNSICIKQECQCPANYRLENNECLPNLGGLCTSTISCDIENSDCINATCTCTEGFVANNTLSCLEASRGLGSDCLENVQCSRVVKNSECDKNKNLTCNCIEGYQNYKELCYPQKYMLDTCTTSTQCNVMLDGNVQCKNGICQCPTDMKMNENKLGCQRSIGFNLKMSQLTFIVAIFSAIKSFEIL